MPGLGYGFGVHRFWGVSGGLGAVALGLSFWSCSVSAFDFGRAGLQGFVVSRQSLRSWIYGKSHRRGGIDSWPASDTNYNLIFLEGGLYGCFPK